MYVDTFFLFPVYSTFNIVPFFSPPSRLFIPSLSVSIAYTYESSFFLIFRSLVLSLTPIHSLTFSRVLRPACTNAIYTYSLRILSRTAYSLAPFLSWHLSSLSDSRDWSGSLFARQPSPPLYSALPSRNRAENLRIEPSRALLSATKKDRCIEERYV